MKTHVMMHPRAEELLVERAVRGLTDAEHAELAALGVEDDDSLDLAAAAVMIATTRMEAMPDELFERMAEPTAVNARGFDFRSTLAGVVAPGQAAPSSSAPALAPAPVASPEPVAPAPAPAPVAASAPVAAPIIPIDSARRRRGVSVAWVAVAAAAGVALAVGGSTLLRGGNGGNNAGPETAAAQLAPADARADLLAHSGDAHALAWTATTDATAHGASGDVVWSTAKQRGYMRFVGLAANDPKAWQYQLWIFDRTRDQAFPVDGGVFDVSSSGEVIVAISPKLHVDDATLFAVTVERPGGVVVSKRERIVVTAKPS